MNNSGSDCYLEGGAVEVLFRFAGIIPVKRSLCSLFGILHQLPAVQVLAAVGL